MLPLQTLPLPMLPLQTSRILAVISLCLLADPVRVVADDAVTLLDWGGQMVEQQAAERVSFKGAEQIKMDGGVRPWEASGEPFSLVTPLTQPFRGYRGTPVFGGISSYNPGNGRGAGKWPFGLAEDGADDGLFFLPRAADHTAMVLAWRRAEFETGRIKRLSLAEDGRLTVTRIAAEVEGLAKAGGEMRLWVANRGDYLVSDPVTLTGGRGTWDTAALRELNWRAMPLRERDMTGMFAVPSGEPVRAVELTDIRAVGLHLRVTKPPSGTELRVKRFSVQAAAGEAEPTWAERLVEAGVPGGLVVVAGVGAGGGMLTEIAAAGRHLVHGLAKDDARMVAGRRAVAEAGVFPLANVATLPASGGRLPYPSEFVRAMIVRPGELDKPLSDAEIERVLAFGGVAWVAEGAAWRKIEKPVPDDVDVWTHAFHGPERLPITNDKRLQPVSGVKWMAGKAINQPQSGLRIAGGRTVALRNIDDNLWLVARDAANGVAIWKRQLQIADPGRVPHGYWQRAANLVATDDRVYCYPAVGGPLVGYDAATGQTALNFEHGAHLPAPEPDPHANRWRSPRLDDRDLLETMAVLVRGGSIVQTMGNQLWMLDENTGRVVYHRKDFAGDLAWASWIEDSLYLVERSQPLAVLALDAATGKTRWRAQMPERFKKVQMFTDGELVTAVDGQVGIGHKATVIALDAATGEQRWANDSAGMFYRGNVFPYDDKVWAMGAWQGDTFLDRKTGNMVGHHRPMAHGGGCGIEVVSPGYLIRGSFLVPRDDFASSYVLNAVRANCEIPVFPAYGQIYSISTGCGCDWYLPGNGFALYRADRVTPVSDAARLHRDRPTPVVTGEPVRRRVDSDVTGDWTWSADIRKVSKDRRWLAFGGKENVQKYDPQPFYTRRSTDPVTADGITLRAEVNSQRLEARRDGEAVWTFLAGSRISVAPVVVDDLAILGCHDGWVYALNVADGSLAWSYLAAPMEKYMTAYGAVESVWPLFGVVEKDGVIYYQAGRSTALDEGLWAGALEAATGKPRWRARAATLPAKIGVKDMRERGYRSFMSRGLGLNGPLHVADGTLYYRNADHEWDLSDPEDMLLNEDVWIGRDDSDTRD